MNEIQEHRRISEGMADSIRSKGYFVHTTYGPEGCDVKVFGEYEDGVYGDPLMVIGVPRFPARQETSA